MLSGEDLVALADRLQADAEDVLRDLALERRVSMLGELIRIGSASCGVMALPDIDIGVLCDELDVTGIFAIARELFGHPCVARVNIVDERGAFQSMPGPENEGIYLGIRYVEGGVPDGRLWKIDLWFFPRAAPRPELAVRDRLRAMSGEERLAVLTIKHALIADGRYGGDGLHGIDVYAAVLDRGNASVASAVARMTGR